MVSFLTFYLLSQMPMQSLPVYDHALIFDSLENDFHIFQENLVVTDAVHVPLSSHLTTS